MTFYNTTILEWLSTSFNKRHIVVLFVVHIVVLLSVCDVEMPQHSKSSAKDLNYSKTFSVNICFLSISAFLVSSLFISSLTSVFDGKINDNLLFCTINLFTISYSMEIYVYYTFYEYMLISPLGSSCIARYFNPNYLRHICNLKTKIEVKSLV